MGVGVWQGTCKTIKTIDPQRAVRWVAVLLTAGALAASGQDVTDFNLARTAAAKSALPLLPTYQGWTNSLNDGSMISWTVDDSGILGWTVASNSFQPYLVWTNRQVVQSVRVWNDDYTGYGRYNAWDQLLVDTLVGPPDGATNEANWVNRYASPTGLAAFFHDVDLGAPCSTYGVRVRVFRPAGSNDVNVGEMAVYGPRGAGPQTLTAARQIPDSTAASSDYGFGRDKSKAVDGVYSRGGYLSLKAADNPGQEFIYEMNYAGPGRAVGSLFLLWTRQTTNFCDVPSAWRIEFVSDGVTNEVGVFTRQPTPVQFAHQYPFRLLYHYDLGRLWRNVTKIRLVVPEENVPNGLGIGINEIEAFSTRVAPREGFMLRVH